MGQDFKGIYIKRRVNYPGGLNRKWRVERVLKHLCKRISMPSCVSTDSVYLLQKISKFIPFASLSKGHLHSGCDISAKTGIRKAAVAPCIMGSL